MLQIRLDGGYVYYVTNNIDVGIYRVPADGSAAPQLENMFNNQLDDWAVDSGRLMIHVGGAYVDIYTLDAGGLHPTYFQGFGEAKGTFLSGPWVFFEGHYIDDNNNPQKGEDGVYKVVACSGGRRRLGDESPVHDYGLAGVDDTYIYFLRNGGIERMAR